MMIRSLVAISFLSVACGGADTPAPDQPTPAAAEHEAGAGDHQAGHDEHAEHKGEHEGEEKHEHVFPATVTAFHDVLSPNWHAEKGAARIDATCSAIVAMNERAVAAKDAPAPEGIDAAVWTATGEALVQSVADLDTACDAEGRPDFEAAFKSLHDQFHVYVDMFKEK